MSFEFEQFTKIFNHITNLVDFDSGWENGTGYFNGAVSSVKLATGEMAKSQDPKGRKIVFIGTRYGTIVVFQRYTAEERLVMNVPAQIRQLFIIDNMMEDNTFCLIFGTDMSGSNNLGKRIEELFGN